MNKYKIISITILALTSFLHLYLTPYSKVEESFNLQATHDLFYNKLNVEKYDHLQYPGVVPRTFLGATLISSLTWFVRLVLLPYTDISKDPLLVEFIARLILLLLNLHALLRLGNAVDGKFGLYHNKRKRKSSIVKLSNQEKDMRTSLRKSISIRLDDEQKSKSYLEEIPLSAFLYLITASQFHLNYYCSRMLPNTFAILCVNHAFAYWFSSSYCKCLSLLTFVTVVIRCDMLLLLGSVSLSMLFLRQVSFVTTIQIGLFTTFLSLLLTIPLDSFLWQEWTWPEGVVLFANTIHNKSKEYGVLPFHWYFTNALPKGMLFSFFFILVSFLRIPEYLHLMFLKTTQQGIVTFPPLLDLVILPFLAPMLLFVDLYSILPHKEIRFIMPCFGMLNVCAAYGAWKINKLRNTLFNVGILILLLISCFASSLFLWVSHYNYPGGEALKILVTQMDQRCLLKSNPNYQFFHSTKNSTSDRINIKVHIDVASAMTGISNYETRYASYQTCDSKFTWQFLKEGYEEENKGIALTSVTHLLSESMEKDGFHVVGVSKGFPRIHLQGILNGEGPVELEDAIYLLERNDFGEKFF